MRNLNRERKVYKMWAPSVTIKQKNWRKMAILTKLPQHGQKKLILTLFFYEKRRFFSQKNGENRRK
jgi:hypothetical protein